MEAEIEKLIRSIVTKDCNDFGLTMFERMWGDRPKEAAAEIAELCEGDKYDALQVQDATWKDIEARLASELATAQRQIETLESACERWVKDFATAQAQVAVMAGAVEYVRDAFKAHLYDDGLLVGEDKHPDGWHWDSIQMANKSLSAAPKVVSVKDIELKDGIFLATGYRGTPGDWVKVIVLDRGEGE